MSEDIDYTKEYDNSGRVANSNELLDNFIMDAALYREVNSDRAQFDLSYGPEPRNMMDLFWPDDEDGQNKKSPIVMFIHGGYWQRMDRSSFSHLSKGLNDRGVAVAMPSYTLCPDISIEGIINEIRRACLVLFQTHKRPITVVGHSAGGHLAACMMATDWEKIHPKLPSDLVASGMGISGLYDLIPICKTPVNDAVGMSEKDAEKASPIGWLPEGGQKFEAWVGGEESNEYHRQSRDLSSRWSLLGTPTNYVSVPDTNHFTVVDSLCDANSDMVEKILELLEHPIEEYNLPEPDKKQLKKLLKEYKISAKESYEEPIEEITDPEIEAEPEPQSETDPESGKKENSEADLEADTAAEEAKNLDNHDITPDPEIEPEELSKPEQPDETTQADETKTAS